MTEVKEWKVSVEWVDVRSTTEERLGHTFYCMVILCMVCFFVKKAVSTEKM